MRIGIANIHQISNSFNRRSSDRQQFVAASEAAPRLASRFAPANDAFIQSMIQTANRNQCTIVPIVDLVAPAGGPLTMETVSQLTTELSERLAANMRKMDVLLLVLSGSMFDAEGNAVDPVIVHTARSVVGTQVPLVCAWSRLANLTQDTVALADLNIGYDGDDQAPIDQTTHSVLDRITRLEQPSIRTLVEFRKLPLLLPPRAWQGDHEPFRSIQQLAEEFRALDGVLDVSIFGGFPFADHPDGGVSCAVTTNGDADLAKNLAGRLRNAIWSQRDRFFGDFINVETAVHEAMLATEHPVIISDAGDDPEFGATSEGTGLLWALIDLGAPDVVLGLIVDPGVVEKAIAAGPGSAFKFDLGGAADHRAGYPVEVKGTVHRIIDGSAFGVGRAATLMLQGRHGGSVLAAVTELPAIPSPDILRALGVDPTDHKIVALKSSAQIREDYGPIAARILEITTPGITTPVLAFFDYQRLTRPIYPLDPL